MKGAPAESVGSWWWAVLGLGAALRGFLLFAGEGTYDVPIWQAHAAFVHRDGLVSYYERSEVFNHPPFAGWLLSWLWGFARAYELPFPVLLRLPTALLDLGNALLLLSLLRGERHRHALVACYWLHPLAWIFSSYHGNTDTAVAFFMLLAVSHATRGGAAAAGVALGVGLWIKLPVLLAAPAIFFALSGLRARLHFAVTAAAVGVSTYLPVLWTAPEWLMQRVFGYAGRAITTPDGEPIWGLWAMAGAPGALPPALAALSELHLAFNTWVCWAPILLLAWLRRDRATPRDLATTVCASLLILYGFTNNLFAFQYLAWVAPFLFFPGPRFAALAALLLGGYVYAVYVLLTGSPLLLGLWDFNGTPHWPAWLLWWRNAAVAFSAISAAGFLGAAALSRWRERARR